MQTLTRTSSKAAFDASDDATISRGSHVDQRTLAPRQIRLYIENSPVYYPLTIATGIFTIAALLWPFVPDDHPKLVLWAGAIIATLLARFSAWLAYSRTDADDDAVRAWLKWFLVPQIFSVIMIGAAPAVFLRTASAHDFEILILLSAFVFLSMFGSSLKVAAYRPLIAIVLTPMTVIYAVTASSLPGIVPKLLGLGGLLVGLLGYSLAKRINDAYVQSMELSIRNEQLAATLEARSAQLQQQTLALQQQTIVADNARRAAERAERDKTRFIAAASHDLRQPMHAISLLVGMLRQHGASSEERDVKQRLERSVEVMDNLFTTILDLSELDSGVLQPAISQVRLSEIFDAVEIHFAPQAAAKQVALHVFPTRAVVRTDRTLLERVLRNLVSNALKYTDEGRVLVGCRRHGDKLTVGVWDTGKGIAPENLERVFEEFFQAGTGTRDRSQGLGLGLAIVQRLARLLGSEVRVSSTLGRGSRFGLDMPFIGYLAATPTHGSAHHQIESTLQNKFVLIVDDEADVRFGAEALLRDWGCRSVSAACVEEVRTILSNELRFPDAIVTDYRLGERKTGLDVITTVREYTGEHTPAVIVTGEYVHKDELDLAFAACPIIKKPVSADELRKQLVAALRGAAKP